MFFKIARVTLFLRPWDLGAIPLKALTEGQWATIFAGIF